jgi:hypothetical protein
MPAPCRPHRATGPGSATDAADEDALPSVRQEDGAEEQSHQQDDEVVRTASGSPPGRRAAALLLRWSGGRRVGQQCLVRMLGQLGERLADLGHRGAQARGGARQGVEVEAVHGGGVVG